MLNPSGSARRLNLETSSSLHRIVIGLACLLGIVGCSDSRSPLDPPGAITTFQLPEGFRIELAASEPQVVDPISIAFDEQGRLYVVEMRDYPISREPVGRIKLLEDVDGDGHYEKASIFADRLHFPHSALPWRGGLLVACAPDLLYLEDTDGDRRADVRQVVLTGFAQVNPQHRFNSPTYEIDNWIYVAYPKVGVGERFKQFSDLGKPLRFPDLLDVAPVDIFEKGLDFRVRPDQGKLEPVAGNSQFGLAFDAAGNRFTSWNARHIQHVVIQYPYLARNPHLIIDSDRHAPSDHGEASRVYPISIAPHRTETRHTSRLSELNHFTSACGQSIYTGGAFPDDYQGAYFVAEPVHNLVHADRLIPDGPTFTARRIEQDRDFLASTDAWFMPVNTATGPDGALYVVDFYRKVVEHPEWIRKEFIDDQGLFGAGIDRGRIYRIVHESQRLDPRPRLDRASSSELVESLSHRNKWWRITAQRLLVERQDLSVAPLLETLTAQAPTPEGRIHALWTLQGLEALTTEVVLGALGDPNPLVREHAVRLAEAYKAEGTIVARLVDMHDDESPRVQFQLACSLGDISTGPAFEALSAIAFRHMDSSWFQTAVLTSIRSDAVRWLEAVEARIQDPETEDHRLEFLKRIAGVIGARQRPQELVGGLKIARRGVTGKNEAVAAVVLEGLAQGLKSGAERRIGLSAPGQQMLLELVENGDPRIYSPALGIGTRIAFDDTRRLRRVRGRALETLGQAATTELKVHATRILALDSRQPSQRVLANLLTPLQADEVQDAAVRALLDLTPLPVSLLLEKWGGFTFSRREAVLEVLLEDPDDIATLLDAIESGQVKAYSLSPNRRKTLLRSGDSAIRARAAALLEEAVTSREEAIEKYRSAVVVQGDPEQGKEVFARHCGKCHKVGSAGFEVGPDLLSLTGRRKEELLADILDPNANIVPGYEEYRLETRDGRIITGVLLEQNANSVTLGREEGERDDILRANIADLRAATVSAMPEGIEEEITVGEMTDLLQYLKSLGAGDQ